MTVRFEEGDVGVKRKTTLLTHFSIQSIISCRKRETHKGQHRTRVGSCVVGTSNLYDPINITLLILKDYPYQTKDLINFSFLYLLYHAFYLMTLLFFNDGNDQECPCKSKTHSLVSFFTNPIHYIFCIAIKRFHSGMWEYIEKIFTWLSY